MTFISDAMTSLWWSVRNHHQVYICFYACYLEDWLFHNVLMVRDFIPGTPMSVTSTDDLEIQGLVILHLILPISATLACTCIVAFCNRKCQ